MKKFSGLALCFVIAIIVGQAFAVGASKCPEKDRHPIILFPGITGTKIEEKFDIPDSVPMPYASCPRKSDGWESSWIEWKKLLPRKDFECLIERWKMYPNEAGDKWTNTPGTDFRVPDWGTVKSIDPLSSEFGKVIRFYGFVTDELKKLGYEDGKTLFIAGYDWRKMETDEWRNDVREMIENAVKTTGKKAVLFTHSMGCPFSYIFLMSQTLEWRQKYIQHYVPVSPPWTGVPIVPYVMITNKMLNITVEPFASLGEILRYLEGPYVLTPSTFFNPDTILARTNINVYTARNQSLLLERVGVKNAEAIIQHIQKQYYRFNFEHPGIPVTSIWSTGALTVKEFKWHKDSEIGVEEPIPEFVDGDMLVPHEVLVYADKVWKSGPYGNITDGIPIPGTNHATIMISKVTISCVNEIACDSE